MRSRSRSGARDALAALGRGLAGGPGVALAAFGVPRLPRMLRAGLALVLVGGAGDLVFHLLPAASARQLEPLLGAGALRAHLLTLAGMALALVAVVRRGLGHGG